MDDIFVYLRDDMPIDQHEYVTPCLNGYTVYINAKLDDAHRIKAYEHALKHIKDGDFDIDNTKDVQEIEAAVHDMTPAAVIPQSKWQDEIERLRAKGNKARASLARKEKQIKRKAKRGYDFFAAAEREWLEP